METKKSDQISTIEQLASRGPVAVFEKRGETVDVINWINKETGKAMSAVVHKIAAEFSATGQQVMCEVATPRDSTLESVKPTGLDKGDFFYGIVGSYIVSKGVHSCRLLSFVPVSALGAVNAQVDYILGTGKSAGNVPVTA